MRAKHKNHVHNKPPRTRQLQDYMHEERSLEELHTAKIHATIALIGHMKKSGFSIITSDDKLPYTFMHHLARLLNRSSYDDITNEDLPKLKALDGPHGYTYYQILKKRHVKRRKHK